MAETGPGASGKSFFEQYTHGLTPADVQKLFTRDTPEAYRYFTRSIDERKLAAEGWPRRWFIRARLLFTAFSMRLSPARRVLYGGALVAVAIGMMELFRGLGPTEVLLFPFRVHMLLPQWATGAMWVFIGFALVNLLIFMEVADRLSLKGDLEIARDIQIAMLPAGIRTAGASVVFGVTQPANTVGGDFYDVLERPDGRYVIALGDVAGKGSPAALLMALLLAMLRTLVDEGLESARLIRRLNTQVARHSPASRFITLFYGLYNPADGTVQYVNAGHLPPLIRRVDGSIERVTGNGLALGLFEDATYESLELTLQPGDRLVLFSDGITEAEDSRGRAFEDAGIEAILGAYGDLPPDELAQALLRAVKSHAGDVRLADDLTAMVLERR